MPWADVEGGYLQDTPALLMLREGVRSFLVGLSFMTSGI